MLFLLISLFVSVLLPSTTYAQASSTLVHTVASHATSTTPALGTTPAVATSTATVPFYSQFKDISSTKWQKVGCGIASLAMVVDYYRDDAPSVDTLLRQGIAAGAYSPAGWTYQGLIGLARRYGLSGQSYDLGGQSARVAFAQLTQQLAHGPVIVSVHYKFEPTNPIPHLVVIDRVDGDYLYYNDPAAKSGDLRISVDTFLKAWKKRFIVIRPTA